MTEQPWSGPPVIPSLQPGAVQVWQLDLADAGTQHRLAAAFAMLTADERERAERTRTGRPRDEFVLGRGYLRLLLGAATARPPHALTFTTGAQGKLALAGEPQLSFSVAHSDGRILLALSRAGALGIDLEARRPEVEALAIAEDTFHPAEIALIAAQPDALPAFYLCWTLKEALLKADGRGLSLPLNSFSVAACAQQILQAGSQGSEGEYGVNFEATPHPQQYWLRALSISGNFSAALATLSPGLPIQCLDVANLPIPGPIPR